MNEYYTLVYKDLNNNKVVCFKMFTTFEKLRIFVKEYLRGGLMKNTRPIDKEKLIYYCEVKQDERLD